MNIKHLHRWQKNSISMSCIMLGCIAYCLHRTTSQNIVSNNNRQWFCIQNVTKNWFHKSHNDANCEHRIRTNNQYSYPNGTWHKHHTHTHRYTHINMRKLARECQKKFFLFLVFYLNFSETDRIAFVRMRFNYSNGTRAYWAWSSWKQTQYDYNTYNRLVFGVWIRIHDGNGEVDMTQPASTTNKLNIRTFFCVSCLTIENIGIQIYHAFRVFGDIFHIRAPIPVSLLHVWHTHTNTHTRSDLCCECKQVKNYLCELSF